MQLTPNSKISRKSRAFLDDIDPKMALFSPFIKAKVNPDSLEDRKVFVTRPQNGFSLKRKTNKNDKIQPNTPIKSKMTK